MFIPLFGHSVREVDSSLLPHTLGRQKYESANLLPRTALRIRRDSYLGVIRVDSEPIGEPRPDFFFMRYRTVPFE